MASSLLSDLSGYVDIGLVFTVDIDTFVPISSSIFTRSFAVVSGIDLHFSTKVRSSLGDRTRLLPERYGVYTCVLLFVQMNMVPSGGWKLLPRMNQTWGGLHFLRWFLFIFPWCQGRPWNTSSSTPPIDSKVSEWTGNCSNSRTMKTNISLSIMVLVC